MTHETKARRAPRAPIATRVEPDVFAEIKRRAGEQRVTPALVARILLEDAVRGQRQQERATRA